MIIHHYNTSTEEAMVGMLLQFWGKVVLYNIFYDNLVKNKTLSERTKERKKREGRIDRWEEKRIEKMVSD